MRSRGNGLTLLTKQRTEEVQGAGSQSYLEHALAHAERLVGHAYTRSFALALDGLGNLQLPAVSAVDDQAHLRTLASLYLASQLEQAGLLPAVELLAGFGAGADLTADLGSASYKLMDFWRHRKERFSVEERRGLYERLFDPDFENLMIGLCEALYKLDEGVLQLGRSNPLQQEKVRTLGDELSERLLNHSTGESMFAATDILASVRTATEILKDPHVEHAYGANSIWTTVAAILRRHGSAAGDPVPFVVRGKAGLTILSWLASADAVLKTSRQPLLGVDNPVIGAAVDWLQSSLAIEQNKAGGQTPAAVTQDPAAGS